MNDTRDTNFVYINTYAAHFVNEGYLKRFIDKKLGKHWNTMSDILIPVSVGEDIINDDFFHGVATAQFSAIQHGGTFINPMIAGFKTDFELWNGIVHKYPDFNQNVTYLDIPYSLYKTVEDDVDVVSEQDYDENSSDMIELVKDLEEEFYYSMKVQH